MSEEKKIKVAIIDYQMGNLFSVEQACQYVGLDAYITLDKKIIMESDAAILPGVGAFGQAMENLKRLDLVEPIKDFIKMKKPFMGICLGLQLLFTESEEFGNHKGLDLINGNVVKFPNKNNSGKLIKIPQIGWNQIYPLNGNEKKWGSSPLNNIRPGEFMFFVHSFYVSPVHQEDILSITSYEGFEYCSSIARENIFAFQFHPEKSAIEGLKIYQNLKK